MKHIYKYYLLFPKESLVCVQMYVLGRDLFISDFYDIVYYKSNIFFSRTDLGGLSRKEIVESVKHSLKNLGTEYIDLVIIHKYDANCPIEGM